MTPDFVGRYPELVEAGGVGLTAGWDVTYDRFGLPFSWRRLSADDVAGYRQEEARIVWSDEDELRSCRCKHLVRWSAGKPRIDRDLQTSLQLLFGIRR